MILEFQMFLDVVPTNDRPSLFDQHQRRVNQDENVTGNVEAAPEVAGLKTAALRLVSFHVASSIGVLDDVESARPTVPEDRSDD